VLAHPTIVSHLVQCVWRVLHLLIVVLLLSLMLSVPLPIDYQVSGLVVTYRLGVTFVFSRLPSRGDKSVGLPTRHPLRQSLQLPLPFLCLYQVMNIIVKAILNLFDLL
jgi:hypothetical protein